MEINWIYQGDSFITLQTFPDSFIDCVITSPPYWGLRDYGTATWEGGDINCSHIVGNQVQDNKWKGAITSGVRPGVNASVCKICNAKRIDKQLGLEKTPEEYVLKLVEVFREVKRILKKEGTVWLNLGDSYAGSKVGNTNEINKRSNTDSFKKEKPKNLKEKDLVGIPWRVAFALQADGWYLRQDIIWSKPNPMPESVRDRCTKSHEYIFLFTKSPKYYFDNKAIQEEATGYDGRKDTSFKGSQKYSEGNYNIGSNAQSLAVKGRERWKYKNLQNDGQEPNTFHIKRLIGEEYLSPVRNKRSVWNIATKPFKEAHFATFPEKLIEPMILAGCPEQGIVLDPFIGAGTTGLVAKKLNRKYIGIELNPEYIKIANNRLRQDLLL